MISIIDQGIPTLILASPLFITYHLEKDVKVSLRLEKILNTYTSFGTIKQLVETVQT